jgi:hypothetical protein
MALENKLGITNAAELARIEEKMSKKRAVELFESGLLDSLEPGTVDALIRKRTQYGDIGDAFSAPGPQFAHFFLPVAGRFPDNQVAKVKVKAGVALRPRGPGGPPACSFSYFVFQTWVREV